MNTTPQHLIALARVVEGEPADFPDESVIRACEGGCGRYTKRHSERVCKQCRQLVGQILRAEADRRAHATAATE